jgi:hypothetical protein
LNFQTRASSHRIKSKKAPTCQDGFQAGASNLPSETLRGEEAR